MKKLLVALPVVILALHAVGGQDISNGAAIGFDKNLSIGDAILVNRQNHGPASELAIDAASRLELSAGGDMRHNGAVQLGVTYRGNAQGVAIPWYFNGDSWANGRANPLGYSQMIEQRATYWNTHEMVDNFVGWRAEARDTNGAVSMMWYAVNIQNPLIGQAPGPVMGEEIWSNGTVHHGKCTEDYSAVSGNTNFGVSWEAARASEIDLGDANLNVTNMPDTYPRTNQIDLHTLYIYNGPAARGVSFPTNWTWGGESTNFASAPTNINPLQIMRVQVEKSVLPNVTNYLAHVSYFSNNVFRVGSAESSGGR